MSDTPRADAKAFHATWPIGFMRSESGEVVDASFARQLECELAQRTAEVEMLRGVGCEADGDGRCGVCIRCYATDARRYRAMRQWPTVELLDAFNAPADGTGVPPEELDEAVDLVLARRGVS